MRLALNYSLQRQLHGRGYALSEEANIKIWLEPEIEVASVKGHVNPAIINEILKEVKRNEQLCKDAWDAYLG